MIEKNRSSFKSESEEPLFLASPPAPPPTIKDSCSRRLFEGCVGREKTRAVWDEVRKKIDDLKGLSSGQWPIMTGM